MQRIIFLVIFMCFNAFGFENKAMVCLGKETPRIKKFYDQLDGTDKFKHCGVSCSLGLRCGVSNSMLVGFAKEIIDLFGPGNADIRDIEANFYGLNLVLSKDAINEKECERICYEAYRY